MQKITETKIIKYTYDSEEEREQHVKWMESQGFECTGRVKRSFGSIYEENPEYLWYGEFYKNY
jgi:hypothetical protein